MKTAAAAPSPTPNRRTTFQVCPRDVDGKPAGPWVPISDRDATMALDTYHDLNGARKALQRKPLRVGSRFIRLTPRSGAKDPDETAPKGPWTPDVSEGAATAKVLARWLTSRGVKASVKASKADLRELVAAHLARFDGSTWNNCPALGDEAWDGSGDDTPPPGEGGSSS